MPSIIIPAHNEGPVISRCLQSILTEDPPEDLEVIVVCNGCRDDTAKQARTYEPDVTVIETDVASKSNALNLGDESATHFPRLYVDADIEFCSGTVRAILNALRECALAVSPTARFDTKHSSLAVRMYYAAWSVLPFYNDSTIGGSGVYAMSEEGRNRFDTFPSIISDDGFVRLQFRAEERTRISDAYTIVSCPRSTRELITMKARVLAGKKELLEQFPNLAEHEETTMSMRLWSVLKNPHLWPCFVVYAYCKMAIKHRVRQKAHSGQLGEWDRDESSRKSA